MIPSTIKRQRFKNFIRSSSVSSSSSSTTTIIITTTTTRSQLQSSSSILQSITTLPEQQQQQQQQQQLLLLLALQQRLPFQCQQKAFLSTYSSSTPPFNNNNHHHHHHNNTNHKKNLERNTFKQIQNDLSSIMNETNTNSNIHNVNNNNNNNDDDKKKKKKKKRIATILSTNDNNNKKKKKNINKNIDNTSLSLSLSLSENALQSSELLHLSDEIKELRIKARTLTIEFLEHHQLMQEVNNNAKLVTMMDLYEKEKLKIMMNDNNKNNDKKNDYKKKSLGLGFVERNANLKGELLQACDNLILTRMIRSLPNLPNHLSVHSPEKESDVSYKKRVLRMGGIKGKDGNNNRTINNNNNSSSSSSSTSSNSNNNNDKRHTDILEVVMDHSRNDIHNHHITNMLNQKLLIIYNLLIKSYSISSFTVPVHFKNNNNNNIYYNNNIIYNNDDDTRIHQNETNLFNCLDFMKFTGKQSQLQSSQSLLNNNDNNNNNDNKSMVQVDKDKDKDLMINIAPNSYTYNSILKYFSYGKKFYMKMVISEKVFNERLNYSNHTIDIVSYLTMMKTCLKYENYQKALFYFNHGMNQMENVQNIEKVDEYDELIVPFYSMGIKIFLDSRKSLSQSQNQNQNDRNYRGGNNNYYKYNSSNNNSDIQILSPDDIVEKAFLYAMEKVPNIETSAAIFSPILNYFAKTGQEWKMLEILNRFQSLNIQPDNITYTTLLELYGKKNNFNEEKLLNTFEKMQNENVGFKCDRQVYATMINSYAQNGYSQQAIHWLNELEKQNFQADQRVYNQIIYSFAINGDYVNAEIWYEKLMNDGFHIDAKSDGALILAYANSGKLDLLLERFNKLHADKRITGIDKHIDNQIYNMIINAFGKQGLPDLACKWMSEQQKNNFFKPDEYSYDFIIIGYSKIKEFEKALDWYHVMLSSGYKNNKCVDRNLVNNITTVWDNDKKHPDHLLWVSLKDTISTHGRLGNLLYTRLIDWFALNNGDMVKAELWYDRMCQVYPDKVSSCITSIMSGYMKQGRPDLADDFFNRKLSSSSNKNMNEILPEKVYKDIISMLLQHGNIDHGLEYLDKMIKDGGYKIDVDICNLFIDGYLSNEDVTEAIYWFTKMEREGIQYNRETCAIMCSIYDAYSRHNYYDNNSKDKSYSFQNKNNSISPSMTTEELFEVLRSNSSENISEKDIYLGMINGFLKRKNVMKAEKLFDKMQNIGMKVDDKSIYVDFIRFYTDVAFDLVKAIKWIDRTEKAGFTFETIYNGNRQECEISLGRILKAYSSKLDVAEVSRIYNKMIEIGHHPTKSDYAEIIADFVFNNSSKKIDAAIFYFEDMKRRDVKPNSYIYNAMMYVYSLKKEPKKVVNLFQNMIDNGITPEFRSYQSVIVAFINAKQMTDAERWVERMSAGRSTLQPNGLLIQHLILGWGKENNDHKVIEWYEKIKAKNIVITKLSRDNIVQSYCNLGQIDKAVEAIDWSVEKAKIPTDIFVYNSLIRAYLKYGRDSEAADVLYDILLSNKKNKRVKANEFSFVSFIQHYTKTAQIEKLKNIIREAKLNNAEPRRREWSQISKVLGQNTLVAIAEYAGIDYLAAPESFKVEPKSNRKRFSDSKNNNKNNHNNHNDAVEGRVA